jgi:hypothetical protein
MFLWRNLSPSALAAVAAALTRAKPGTAPSADVPAAAKDAGAADSGIAKN